jgi:hypothetical protein
MAFAHLGSYDIASFLANARSLPPNALSAIAIGFLIAAAAKSAQAPLHTWLPDAMEAPTPVSALIHAATMVNAGVYLLARFYPAFEGVPGWTTAVVTLGLLSALLAAALALVAAGVAVWQWRMRLSWLTGRLRGLTRMASDGFGFEWINQVIIDVTKRAAEALRRTQTGHLNWNVAGMVGGLIVVLALLAWGA